MQFYEGCGPRYAGASFENSPPASSVPPPPEEWIRTLKSNSSPLKEKVPIQPISDKPAPTRKTAKNVKFLTSV